jgi:ubiquinone/menaquinone biosynthesis C-methylase UbiE
MGGLFAQDVLHTHLVSKIRRMDKVDAPKERPGDYLHGAASSEQRRLEVQAKILGGSEFLPLLHAGMRVLEVGCGTGAVAREVASKVTPGEVIGIDREEAQVETARQLAAEQDVRNVHFLRGDASALDYPEASFDAAYCRFVLEHVPNPKGVLGEMYRVVKPGGWVCAYEWEAGCFITYPESIAIAQVWQSIYHLQETLGGDPYVGRKLYGIFQEIAFGEVRAEGRAWTITAQDQEQLARYVEGAQEIIRQTSHRLLAEQLATPEGVKQAQAEYEQLLASKSAFVFHGFCRAIGKKRSAP